MKPKNNKTDIVSLEQTPDIIGVTSRKTANIEKCNRICNMYLEIAKLPQYIGNKKKRLEIACCIKTIRHLYLFS